MSSSESPWNTVREVSKDDGQALAHPLSTAMGLFEYDYPPPEHIFEIYLSVYNALSPYEPRAPKNLARFMPREHAKSEAGTVVTPTWAALRDPNIRILLMSETEDQAKGKLRECREHIERLIPQLPCDHEIIESNKTELTLKRTATYDVPTIKAAGFNTGITGGHFDLLVFDDIISWESQRTEERREKKWAQFQDYYNLGSEGESVFVVLGTRKHPEDLYSHLIDGPGWDSKVRKAIDDWSLVENGEYDVITDAGNHYRAADIGKIDTAEETIVDVEPHRDVDVLWPERWDLQSLLMDMISGFGSDQGTLVWQRENQNDAMALQGQILTEDMLFYESALPNKSLLYYAGIDLGIEDDPDKAARGDSDYWAVGVIANDPTSDTTYLVDIKRRRGMTLKQGIKWVKGVLQPYDISATLAEANQAQRWFTQTAQDMGLRVEKTTSTGDKEDRIISMSSRFESGKVRLLEDAVGDNWQSFVNEWVSFPTGNHDDRLDATEIALRNLDTSSVTKSKHSLGSVI